MLRLPSRKKADFRIDAHGRGREGEYEKAKQCLLVALEQEGSNVRVVQVCAVVGL